jgi:hypothetical protein
MFLISSFEHVIQWYHENRSRQEKITADLGFNFSVESIGNRSKDSQCYVRSYVRNLLLVYKADLNHRNLSHRRIGQATSMLILIVLGSTQCNMTFSFRILLLFPYVFAVPFRHSVTFKIRLSHWFWFSSHEAIPSLDHSASPFWWCLNHTIRCQWIAGHDIGKQSNTDLLWVIQVSPAVKSNSGWTNCDSQIRFIVGRIDPHECVIHLLFSKSRSILINYIHVVVGLVS